MDWNVTISIIAGGVGIIGIYQFILFVISIINRPIIEIGILPHFEIKNEMIKIEDIGNRSAYDEFIFNKKYFAKRTNTNTPFKKLANKKRINRLINRSPDSKYEFPIIIFNRGLSGLKDYELMISFIENNNTTNSDTKIHLLDVHTETAKIDGLYVDSDSYEGEDKSKIPSRKIIEIYKDCRLSAHFVSLIGILSSGTYEMFYLKVLIPDTINEVAFYYEIDMEKPFRHTNRYSQLVRIIN